MSPPTGERDNRKKSDIKAARNNLKYGFPIGILHKLDKGVYRVLGLGQITEETEDGIFIVKPYIEYIMNENNGTYGTINEPQNTESLVETKQRIGQDQLRSKLINKYKCCKICGLDIIELLIASHIKPWKDSDDQERLDINNGLLLCPNHDKLFDKGFISFDDNGNIIISDLLKNKNLEITGINENIKINMNEENKKYIKWHREKCLKQDLY